VKPYIIVLVQLQRVDLKAAELRRAKASIPEEIETGRRGLEAAQAAIEQTRADLEELLKGGRAKERSIEEVREGQIKKKGRLMEVKTNEEYSALLKEIEYADQQVDVLEEELLGLMEKVDSAQAELQSLQERLKVEEERFGKEKGLKEEELQRVVALLDEEEARREEFSRQLPDELLANYERIRSSKNGLAVVQVVDAVCQGCNQRIPTQTYINIKNDEIIYYCQGCSRILFCSDEEG
jgi:predicted  nucleic acid-binding Zn-ribbon protein